MGISNKGHAVKNACSYEGAPAPIARFYTSKTWIEGAAERQLDQVAALDGVHQLAAFPDLHPGKYGPVGIALLADRLYPQLIGNDVGCGMALFKTSLMPRKFKKEKVAERLRTLSKLDNDSPMGTIGGGNHFVEVQSMSANDHLDDRCLYLLIHSGSRGHGNTLLESTMADFGPTKGLIALNADSRAGRRYLDGHATALDFAMRNRAALAQKAGRALRCDVELVCDNVHNALTEHDGFWLHRKGAADATQQLVPIAGTRETTSSLVAPKRLDLPSLASLAHGAGRKYERSKMHGRIQRNKSSLAGLARPKGSLVVCEDKDLLIEEAGAAYKNPRAVIEELTCFELIEPIAEMTPLLTYKKARVS